MRILIQGGHVIDPGRLNAPADILIDGGTIVAVGHDLAQHATNDHGGSSPPPEIIDATGLLVLPGFIDLHTHLREPGLEYKETIQTGTASAVAGGFTSICCMPNTQPVNDNQAVTQFILEQSRAAGNGRVYPVGAITKGSEGKELAEIGELKRAGCIAISDDGRPVMNSLVMRRALEYAQAFDMPVVDHCEDLYLSEDGSMHEGVISTELGLAGIPTSAEEILVARDISLAGLTGGRIHIAHISTAGAVRMVREAKHRGLRVTAEVTPHHWCLTDEAVRGFNTQAKMNPPLRTRKDVEALKEGLKDGTIDAIATDHAPHASQEKQLEFSEAPFGVVGLETAFPLTLGLVEEGVLSLETAVAKLTTEPARVFGLAKGTLAPGADADVVVANPQALWEVDPVRFRSKSRNSPFAGWHVRGQIVLTLVGGTIVFRANGRR